MLNKKEKNTEEDFEMSPNDCYSLITPRMNNAAITSRSNKSWKCFGVVITLAVVLNFLLLIGATSALYNNHKKLSMEFDQLFESAVMSINISGQPGIKLELRSS